MLSLPSLATEIIRWIQLILSMIYPIAIIAILALALRDFRRLVDNQIRRNTERNRLDHELEKEVREFSD